MNKDERDDDMTEDEALGQMPLSNLIELARQGMREHLKLCKTDKKYREDYEEIQALNAQYESEPYVKTEG